MNLTKLSAVAEIVSSVAILVTLAYLALEMRQNTVAIQATIRQAMLAEDRELLLEEIEYPFLNSCCYDVGDLTDEEKLQLSNWLVAFARTRENHWLQYQSGVIDEATWLAYLAPFQRTMSREQIRAWWRIRTATGEFEKTFVDHVNEILADEPIRPLSSVSEATGFE